MATGVPLTTMQLVMKLEHYTVGKVINLALENLSQVDMLDPRVRELFTHVTETISKTGLGYIDLSFADISGRDFSRYNLSNVIFSGANAEHAVFAECDLTDTPMDGAKLDFVDFRGASMRYTKLFGASIRGANFSRANLIETYGLFLALPKEECIKRMGVVSSIQGTVLPENAERYREDIEELIHKRYPIPAKLRAVKTAKVRSSVNVPYVSYHPDDFGREEAW